MFPVVIGGISEVTLIALAIGNEFPPREFLSVLELGRTVAYL